MPMLHGVRNVGGLDNVLNHNRSPEVISLRFDGPSIFRESFLPTVSSKVVQFLIKNIRSKHGIHNQLPSQHASAKEFN
jgi:hypothetical protein